MSNWSEFKTYTDLSLIFILNSIVGVYLITSGGKVIYVGKADYSLKNRLSDHLKFSTESNKVLVNYLMAGGCRFSLLEVPQKIDRDRIEKELIQLYSPVCNKQNNPFPVR
ncbi:MAG: hypothetical protein US68_C0001G0049 [Candidatus Shapirobacteria bacterium GW2011_GWE1_38_10]|uniref:GIY-YIG domain-containing protein n=1 Tax=Candidatus Shapirobacteria bacterium GW2011_GWE1_38_10 TaxID=1618488 RepID=A0A0G0IIL1_9BACT|nr:MAG: hypothetical protein US46_C0004G0033 [Candidatus Shapirobacteria bacterium GW2011_GWF2_37_20]KKQ50850.1 MAG: hypothetical protein US68_C0001G0049 [Candidatus Shapirobacteria bacterium GW2011_GWE1_38_10]HBP51062.1 hypothetical protein [Candidatus Shapirobacteria bacterium]